MFNNEENNYFTEFKQRWAFILEPKSLAFLELAFVFLNKALNDTVVDTAPVYLLYLLDINS